MKIIYIGTACAPNELKYYASLSKQKLVYTQQNWDYSLCKEMSSRFQEDFFVLSYPPIGCFPNSNKLFLKSKNISNIKNGKILGTILLPYIKQILVTAQLKKEINSILNRFREENITIITHAIYYQSLKVAFNARKKNSRVKVISLVPDMPAFLSRTVKNHTIVDYYNKLTINAAMNVDAYVCFSKHQMEDLNSAKPYIVLNGFVDPTILENEIVKNDVVSMIEADRRIKMLYAGNLSKEMGINSLIEAFKSIKNNSARLYLCGNGELVGELQDSKDDRIVYLGVLPRETVILLEQRCDLLINPRLIEEAFSKKSFPSKTFEYLVSGVPVLSSHLKCFSSEYDQYMVYFENNTIEEYSIKLQYCLDNINTLKDQALLAKKFVLEKKSVKRYCDELIEFIGL